MSNDSPERVEATLDHLLAEHPKVAERFYRQLLTALHTRGLVSIDEIFNNIRDRDGVSASSEELQNQVEHWVWDEAIRGQVEQLVREHACRHFNSTDIEDIFALTLKREATGTLQETANLRGVTWGQLADAVHRFCELPEGQTLPAAEAEGIRVRLIHHFISDQLEFIGVAKNYIRTRDFDDLTRRIIGSPSGVGRIGGKAGGMYLAYKVLAKHQTEGGAPSITIPDSYFLRSDVIEEFMKLNRLSEYNIQKYKPVEQIRSEFALIRGLFRSAAFPVEIRQQLRSLLSRTGAVPLIVRSSSLLEDRFGAAFSGKYASLFVANQGDREDRLNMLLDAIADVYASTLGPDPLLYRREHHLIDYDEDMAVLIQKVVGTKVGPYLLPTVAGVAFSRNEYPWAPQIRPEDGMMRMVMGLGTRAVDRVGDESPRMVALGAPTVRPENDTDEIVERAQRHIDVINLEANRLESVTLADLLATGAPIPMLDQIVSIRREDDLYTAPGTRIDAPPDRLCITFDKLLKTTDFARRIRWMLDTLQAAYGTPVEVEFACDGEALHVLQCRTINRREAGPAVHVPQGLTDDQIVFTASKFVRTGLVDGIEYIVYVPSAAYDAVPTADGRLAVGRVVGRVNRLLKDKRFILMGPGRWGSSSILLGVKVTYVDIHNARMLIEVARDKGGYVPEVSFGTHFFQDLVEAGILYLPLYPDQPPNRFNHALLGGSPNALCELLPDEGAVAEQVRVIHVPAVTDGRRLCVALDGTANEAVGYLT